MFVIATPYCIFSLFREALAIAYTQYNFVLGSEVSEGGQIASNRRFNVTNLMDCIPSVVLAPSVSLLLLAILKCGSAIARGGKTGFSSDGFHGQVFSGSTHFWGFLPSVINHVAGRSPARKRGQLPERSEGCHCPSVARAACARACARSPSRSSTPTQSDLVDSK